MNANDIRQFINDHPDGVVIRMIDGTKYKVPHRDYVWLTPAFGGRESRFGRYATAFGVYQDEELRWVNCLLVAEITPLKGNANGNGHAGGRKKRRRRRG